MYQSVATIDSPEFINVTPYNPLISKCEIKVLYVGENRNKSFISKEVATEMANSLPGCPIVGYFKEDKGDFSDHGQKVIIEGGEIKFETMTKPYGFIAPNASVWFQTFEETDEFGNTHIREYLMTTGYLWTGQYEEAQRVIERGNNQSMELDSKTLDGKWAKDSKSGIEFFIINDAIFSKIAILGEDVEPCFEGASITAPKISASFSVMDDDFKITLFSMMQDLQSALSLSEGGLNMAEDKETKEIVEEPAEYAAPEAPEETVVETEFVKDEEDAETEHAAPPADEEDTEASGTTKEDDTPPAKASLETEDTDLSLLQAQYEELQSQFAVLEIEVQDLREYKNNAEDEKKDAMIASFYMLSDEDKKDVIDNKSQYTLDEIEAKLSVIAVRNRVSFDLEDTEDDPVDPEAPITTFNLEGAVDGTPAFVQRLREVRKN